MKNTGSIKEQKARADAFLKQYKEIKKQKKYISEQMFLTAQLYEEFIKTSSFAERKNEDGDRHLRSYLKNLEEQIDTLQLRVNSIICRQRIIENMVNQLEENEREVIRAFYLEDDRKRICDDLMETLDYEKSHIYRLKDRALLNIYSLMDACPELLLKKEIAEYNRE